MENSAPWKDGGSATGEPVGYGINDITVMSIRFSPDGKVVACGGTNNTVVVWDTKTWGRRVLRPIVK
jgi:WD40 repeat protein